MVAKISVGSSLYGEMCIRDSLNTVNLEDDEPLAEQVDVLRGVEQEVIASSPVILPHGGEHIINVEVGLLHLYLTLRQFGISLLDNLHSPFH